MDQHHQEQMERPRSHASQHEEYDVNYEDRADLEEEEHAYYDEYDGCSDDDEEEEEILPRTVSMKMRSMSMDSILTVSTMSETSVSSSSDSWTNSGAAGDVEEGQKPLLLAHAEDISSSSSDDEIHKKALYKQGFKLCFGTLGIYACYLAYGNFQEDIFRYRSADGTGFKNVWFLQVLECACNVVVGFIGRKVFGGHRPASLVPFFQAGASQVFAKVLTTLSLAAGLSFPVCILAKSAKMIPVMLGQIMLGGSKYTWRDYLFACGVVGGVTMLSMSKASSKDAPDNSTAAGLFFIILSLVADGITGGLEKRLKHDSEDSNPPTTYDFLFFINLSMGLVALSIALVVGDAAQGIYFLLENPQIRHMIMMVCFLSAMGQTFIFFVIAHFDPMMCATVTTTRKIMSVLWSITVKGHSVSQQGHAGLVLAITSILLGLREKIGRKMKQRQQRMQHKK